MADNSTNPDPSPDPVAGGQGGTVGAETRSDRVLLRRAMAKRWPVTDTLKEKLVRSLETAIENPKNARDLASLTKVIVAMEGQNQADERAQGTSDTRDALLSAPEVANAMDAVTAPGKPEDLA